MRRPVRVPTCRRSSIDGDVSRMSNDGASITQECENPTNARSLTRQWKDIDWDKAEGHVRRLQTRISKAYRDGKTNLARRLQHLLTNSFYAKAISVRRVSQKNKGKRTPGVDGVLWLTDAQRMRATLSLNVGSYHAKPTRRIQIPKKNGKMRPLSIPTMYDRAMQALYALALDPIQEATADPNSYGFRIGRSCQDAMRQIFNQMAPANRPQWVLEGDIKGCFDNFSHQWMLDNIPMNKRVLGQFIKAGYVFQGTLFPSEKGSPQGGVISPILANMVLNCMEREVRTRFKGVNLIRFADDFVVVVHNHEEGEAVKAVLVPFLKERGLELSEEKTLITHINDGFDFLGWNFRKYKAQGKLKLLIKPSKKSVQAIKKTIRETVLVHGLALTQDELLKALNPKLRGWSGYHRSSVSKQTFSYIDSYVYSTLLRWGEHRHPKKGRKWIMNKYWHRRGKRRWEFYTEKNSLFRVCDVRIVRHTMIRNKTNPYIDTEYYASRQKVRKYERGYRDKDIAM